MRLKPGMGFDYAEFGKIVENRQTLGAASATLPGKLDLRLDGVRTVRIKALDDGGRPMPRVGFSIWLVHKEGRGSNVNVPSRLLTQKTGLDGIATFDWLPPSKDLLQFWPVDPKFARRRIIVEEGQTEPVTVRPFQNETIRGRVIFPDGSPAPDIDIQAYGSGRGLDNGQDQTQAADDGSYELRVSPGEAYAVYIDDKNWAAPSHLDVIVREGKPVDGVDFKLTRGTRIHGTVTIGPHRRPAASHFIGLDEAGGRAPDEFRDPHDYSTHQVRRQFSVLTNADGRYSIRVGPGTYTLMGPPRTRNETITVTSEAELVRDFNMPRPEKGIISGRVVVAGEEYNGVAKAIVEIAAASNLAVPVTVTADAEGRFEAVRSFDPLVVCAHSPDGSLGGMAEVGDEDPFVTIVASPTASASGLLLDEQGKPAVSQQLDWGRRVYLNAEKTHSRNASPPRS